MKSKFPFLLILMATLFAALASGEEPSIVKIGAIVPLSGQGAVYGNFALAGLTLAIEEENIWRKEQKLPAIQLSLDDNQLDVKSSLSIFHRYFEKDFVGVYSLSSSVAMALAPVSNKLGMPLLELSAVTENYSTPEDFTFRTAVLAPALIKEIQQALTSKRIGALIIESEYGESMLRNFQATVRTTLTQVERFRLGDGDIRAQLLRLRGAGIEQLWVVSQVRDFSLNVRQIKEQLPNVQIISDCFGVESQDFLSAAGAAAEGIVYAAPSCVDGARSAVGEKFYSHFTSRYGHAPAYYESLAYDAGRAFALALRNCRTATRDCLRGQLMQLDAEGVCGKLRFNKFGDVDFPAALKIIEHGKFIEFSQ